MSDETPHTASRRLRRSATERVVAGVAGGVAEYLRIDPLIVRIAIVIIGLFEPAAALIAYIVGWAVIPDDGNTTIIGNMAGGTATATSSHDQHSTGQTAGPSQPTAASTEPSGPPAPNTDAGRSRWYIGVALVALGLILLVNELLPTSDDVVLALMMVGGGILLVVQGVRNR